MRSVAFQINTIESGANATTFQQQIPVPSESGVASSCDEDDAAVFGAAEESILAPEDPQEQQRPEDHSQDQEDPSMDALGVLDQDVIAISGETAQERNQTSQRPPLRVSQERGGARLVQFQPSSCCDPLPIVSITQFQEEGNSRQASTIRSRSVEHEDLLRTIDNEDQDALSTGQVDQAQERNHACQRSLPPRVSQAGGNRRSVQFHHTQCVDSLPIRSSSQSPQFGEKGEGRQPVQVFTGLGVAQRPGKGSKGLGRALRIVKLWVRPLGHQEVEPQQLTVLLDGGANITVVDESTFRAFGLPIELNLETLTTAQGSKGATCARIQLEISKDQRSWYEVREAMTLRNLTFVGPDLHWEEFCRREPEFREVQADSVRYGDVRLILGAEVEKLFEPRVGGRRIEAKGVRALETELGWTLGGLVPGDLGIHCNAIMAVPQAIPEEYKQLLRDLAMQFQRMNDLDMVPRCRAKYKELSRQEIRDQEQLDRTTTTSKGYVEVPMLWHDPRPSIPESWGMAMRRLRSLEDTLEKAGPEIFDKYRATIYDDLAKNYIRELNPLEVKDLMTRDHWFLPHFVVFHPDKPDRPRRVLDCAAKVDGTSLNTLLRTGPNNLPNLNQVIYRGCCGEILIMGDAKEMFMQVRVAKADQDMLAFLWREKGEIRPKVFCYDRHVFGAKESPAIAVHAMRVAVKESRPDLLEIVEKCIYMDDLQASCDTVQEAVDLGLGVAEAVGRLGFKMTKWASNSKEVLAHFPPEDLAPPFKEVMEDKKSPLPTAKALGMKWNSENDTFCFSCRPQKKRATTVAEVLSQLASVFDALQIVGPYIMAGKLFLQSLQMAKEFNWAMELTDEQQQWWDQWYAGLQTIAELSIPRWYGIKKTEPVAVHAFADASTAGYGVIVYLVSPSSAKVSFVQARSRVANKRKQVSIPRLELQALLLSTRVVDQFLEGVEGYANIIRLWLWTDSSTVWFWSHDDSKRYKEYVRNRLDEVKDFVEKNAFLQPEIRWLGTKVNPADLISRGSDTVDHLWDNWEFWIKGPPFLTKPIESWPKSPAEPVDEDPNELSKLYAFATLGAGATYQYESLEDFQQALGYRTVQEAELELASQAQKEALAEEDLKELQRLQRQGEEQDPPCYFSKLFKTGRLKGRSCFMDEDGLVRVATRLQQAEFLSFDEKNPIVVPSKSPASSMLVRGYHHRANHAGPKLVASLMSKKFIVPTSYIKKIVHACAACRARNPLPMKIPMASLHYDRLGWGHVFKYTGMDFFGPFKLAQGMKAHGLLFTCMTTRAMHLETVNRVAVTEWAMAVERFVARRGSPATITCDRASTFLSGAKQVRKVILAELTEQFGEELGKQLSAKFGIEFRFTPAYSPHFNGATERLIREVKGYLLKAVTSVSRLSRAAFSTFLVKAEGILNQRPLAIDDDGRVITPATILSPSSSTGYGFPTGCSLAHVLGQQRQAVDYFWKNWTDSYIKRLSLPTVAQTRGSGVRVGDKVLIHWDDPANKFKGVHQLTAVEVTKIFPGADGMPRRMEVKGPGETLKEVAWNRLYLGEVEALGRPDVHCRIQRQESGKEGVAGPAISTGEC